MRCSVVIPVFNKAPYLRDCLDSVFAQSYGDFELIAVDDSSTDDSLAILRSYTDPRMRIIELERNEGPGLAAQVGMDAARGEFIMRVDADDVLMHHRFQRQLEFMTDDPGVGVCGSQMLLLDRPDIRRNKATDDASCKAQLIFGVAMYQPTMAFRRDVLQKHGIRYAAGWPRYGEDWHLQVLLAGVTRFANIDEPLVHYREGLHNTVHGRDRWADLSTLFTWVFRALDLQDPTEEQLEVHAMAVKYFRRPLDGSAVIRFRAWLDELAAWNDREGRFDRAAFRRRLDRAWVELFPYLPRFGSAATMAWFRAGGTPTIPRLYYWFRTAIKPDGTTSSSDR